MRFSIHCLKRLLCKKSEVEYSAGIAEEKNADLVLSDWFELVEGDDLEQGDILQDCPVFLPGKDLEWPIDSDIPKEPEFELFNRDVIIMSQSCDLKPGQKSDMWLVVLCQVWSLSEVSRVNNFLASNYGREECRRGHLSGYHMINSCDNTRWKRETSIVSFREISLPLDFIRKMVCNMGYRLRLRPPYKEHLAQSFARYFMRVGLPVDIPPFTSEKAENEVMRRLEKMDDETRQRILSYFK